MGMLLAIWVGRMIECFCTISGEEESSAGRSLSSTSQISTLDSLSLLSKVSSTCSFLAPSEARVRALLQLTYYLKKTSTWLKTPTPKLSYTLLGITLNFVYTSTCATHPVPDKISTPSSAEPSTQLPAHAMTTTPSIDSSSRTFHPFSRLPMEIRLQIWGYATPYNFTRGTDADNFRIVRIQRIGNTYYRHEGLPTIFFVNRESRYEAARVDGGA
jgi:hypothetical protein